jgi:YidC/Oxa1 family membrane protein insertase
MDLISEVFTRALLDPMINLLIVLNNVLFGNFGLALIAFTILIRAATFPLTLRQLRQTRMMQQIQPRIQEIQKKYSDPKRRQEEVMRVYRESGINPLGCVGPMVLQFPILIGLYYAIRKCLAVSPEALESLSGHLYSWAYIQHAVPLDESFLGLDLRHPNLFMVFLVALTTWAQSKTTVTVATSDTARQQQQMMQWMLPVMFAFFALTFPSGLSLYWVTSALVSIFFNILTYGLPILNIKPVISVPTHGTATQPVPAGPSLESEGTVSEMRTDNEQRRTLRRNKRQNRRRRNQ